MKPPPGPAAASPDPGDERAHLVLDTDKFRADAYLVNGTSVSASQANADLTLGRPEDMFVLDGDHHVAYLEGQPIEVRRRQDNPIGAAFGFIDARSELNAQWEALVRLLLYAAPRSMTTFAALLAGQKHSASRDEWLAHLSGELRYQFGRWCRLRAALGFVAAAARFRAQDLADLAWVPIDAVLRSRFLSGILIVGPVIVVTVLVARHDGRFGLVAQIGSIGAVGAFFRWLIYTGREWRGVRPPEHRPRRAKE